MTVNGDDISQKIKIVRYLVNVHWLRKHSCNDAMANKLFCCHGQDNIPSLHDAAWYGHIISCGGQQFSEMMLRVNLSSGAGAGAHRQCLDNLPRHVHQRSRFENNFPLPSVSRVPQSAMNIRIRCLPYCIVYTKLPTIKSIKISNNFNMETTHCKYSNE